MLSGHERRPPAPSRKHATVRAADSMARAWRPLTRTFYSLSDFSLPWPPRSRSLVAGRVSHGVNTTFGPLTVAHPGDAGPFAQPHQFSVALTVPPSRFATPT